MLLFRRGPGPVGEFGGGDEQALSRPLVPEGPGKLLQLRPADGALGVPALGLDINLVKAQLVFPDDAVDAAVLFKRSLTTRDSKKSESFSMISASRSSARLWFREAAACSIMSSGVSLDSMAGAEAGSSFSLRDRNS